MKLNKTIYNIFFSLIPLLLIIGVSVLGIIKVNENKEKNLKELEQLKQELASEKIGQLKDYRNLYTKLEKVKSINSTLYSDAITNEITLYNHIDKNIKALHYSKKFIQELMEMEVSGAPIGTNVFLVLYRLCYVVVLCC